MVSSRELVTTLSNIELACRNAIDTTTGAVDVQVIIEQATKLKTWIAEFANMYATEAKRTPKSKSKILEAGYELAKDAWFCYEILCELEIESGGPPPTLVKWEPLPSGVVKDELKAQTLTELANLIEAYRLYRRNVLMT